MGKGRRDRVGQPPRPGRSPISSIGECWLLSPKSTSSLEKVRVLAEAWPAALLAKTTTGETPLSLSVFDRDDPFSTPHEVVTYLATKEPRALEEADEERYLPLHRALWSFAPLPVVRTLAFMYPGALRARTNDGKHALHLAAERADSTVLEFLLKQYPEAVQARTYHGELPLHCAVNITEDFRVVQTLVRRNPAALQAKTEEGCTPMHLAARRSWLDVARFFVDQDPAGLRAKTNDGLLPLHLAAHNEVEMVQFLVERDPATVEATTNNGSLPLHFAAQSGQPEIVQLLANAYPQAARRKNTEGFLPLHLAGQSVRYPGDLIAHEHLSLIYILARTVPEAIRRPEPRP